VSSVVVVAMDVTERPSRGRRRRPAEAVPASVEAAVDQVVNNAAR